MMTNVLQMLHTTAAYQNAAMQLMVNEANFVAKQLELGETIPAVAVANTNEWYVEPPPNGIGGSVTSSNYTFDFRNGRLQSINKYRWSEKLSPPLGQLWELSQRASLLDTNSAYQLAAQRLASLSIDVGELEKKHQPSIFQVPARKTDADGRSLPGVASRVELPLFMIGWGEDEISILLRESLRTNPPPARPDGPTPTFRRRSIPNERCPIFIKILGTTKELLELSINDSTLWRRASLQLTNADALLGPLPPPRHFVEELVGGKKAYETITQPDKVEAWLLTSSFTSDGERQKKRNRAGPAKLTPTAAEAFSKVLLDFDSYVWRGSKRCIVDYGVRLRFVRAGDIVEFLLCYECDILEVTHQGKTREANFDPARKRLVEAIKAVFPQDDKINSL